MIEVSPFNGIHYLDFHTHRERRQADSSVLEIISVHLGDQRPEHYHTVGKHPWLTLNPLSIEEIRTLEQHLAHPLCLAMGEIGLDKLKGPKLAIQSQILEAQLTLADALQRPVILHCVRTFDRLIQLKKKYKNIPAWCIHGYSRHAQLAKQLINQGFYLSLMPMVQPSESDQELLLSLPQHQFFLETDSMPHITIEALYLQVAKILNISVQTLQKQLLKNAKTFFNHE